MNYNISNLSILKTDLMNHNEIIHDGILEEFEYNIDSKTIKILIKNKFANKELTLFFNNVVLYVNTGVEPFLLDDRPKEINGISFENNDLMRKILHLLIDSNAKKISFDKLLCLSLEMFSGNVMFVLFNELTLY